MNIDEKEATIRNVVSDLQSILEDIHIIRNGYSMGNYHKETMISFINEKWVDAQLAAEYI